MAAQRKAEIEALLGPTVQALGLELWGSELALSRAGGLLRLYIDHPDRPVTLEDCEQVSREVSALLDVHDPISGNYTLEVSSPGLDRPLFRGEQYARFVGSDVRATTGVPIDGRRRFLGRIASVDGDRVTIEMDTGPVTLAVADIEKAKLVPRFAPAQVSRSPRKGKKA
ncbi:MAG: ribosome maturation factor RimP [Rhodanobacteraceae bacterium]|nr:ribosome maturation factor RimP [Rhodanobacteraceae bacterium]